MNTAEKRNQYTLAKYLQMEEENEFRSEFHDGEIFAMAGGTGNHNKIGSNIMGEIRSALKGKPCSTFNSDMKVWIESANSVVYPDGIVVCGKDLYLEGRKDILLNPELVVEVLSKGTAAYDRGGKFRKYQMLPSFREYVLVEQNLAHLDVYTLNQEGFWEYRSYSGLDSEALFKTQGIKVPLKEIYHRVSFEEEEEEA